MNSLVSFSGISTCGFCNSFTLNSSSRSRSSSSLWRKVDFFDSKKIRIRMGSSQMGGFYSHNEARVGNKIKVQVQEDENEKNNLSILQGVCDLIPENGVIQCVYFEELFKLGRYKEIIERFEELFRSFGYHKDISKIYVAACAKSQVFPSLSFLIEYERSSLFSSGSSESSGWKLKKWSDVLGIIVSLLFGFYLLLSLSGLRKDSIFKKAHSLVKSSDIRFSDVAGIDEAKAELVEAIDYLKNPSKYIEVGAKPAKGILLTGEPGTGKTLLAKAVAGEAKVPYFYISGAAINELYVGMGSRRIRSLFADARKNAPCIVFIDELDAVAGERGLRGDLSATNDTLCQILTEIDGFTPLNNVLLIGATNRLHHLDTALLRPGRFDKIVHVPLPNKIGRAEIFKLYLKRIRCQAHILESSSEKVNELAASTPGFTGADIKNLINLAALKAATLGLSEVSVELLEDSKDSVIMGYKRKGRGAALDEKTRKITAVHEAGHALVAMFSKSSDPLHKVTVCQRGESLGMVSQIPTEDQYFFTKQQLDSKIAVCLGGRAAEELVFGHQNITSGAFSDFKVATSLAIQMVTKFGMNSRIGCIFLNDNHNQSSFERKLAAAAAPPYSNAFKKAVDEEVKRKIDYQFFVAKKIISSKIDLLHEIARQLLLNETLTREDIEKIVFRHV